MSGKSSIEWTDATGQYAGRLLDGRTWDQYPA